MSLSINLFGQDFTFNNVDVNATECSFYNVYLSSNNEALLSGWETDAYYNGVAVNILSNSYNGDIFSVVETNDGMYALALRGGQYLYKWDNSNKVWGYTSIYPPVYNEISNILVVKPNLSVFISRYGDSLKMWKFNDTSFTLIKTIDNVDRYTDGFYFQPYIRENNVI